MKFEFVENENKYISADNVELLRDFLLISDEIRKGLGLRFPPMQICGNEIRFNGIAANLKFNDIELIVKPKISDDIATGKTIDELMRILYLRILRTSKSNLNSVIYFTSMSAESVSNDSFIDCVAQYYLDRLNFAVRKLPIVTYYLEEQKRTAIKGKILIQRELMDPVRDGKTWCRYKTLSKENYYNALLKWCCMFFAENVGSKNLRIKLNRLAEELEGDVNGLNTQLVKRMRLPRNFDAYREPFSIAKELYLYNGQSVKLTSDKKHICGYVINMEKAFENIVSYYAERFALSKQFLHVPQAETVLATSDSKNNDLTYHVKPDDLLSSGNYRLVMDAKYKYITGNDKPNREDFYQMISSCIAYDTYEAILIYPSVGCSDVYNESWTLKKTVNEKKMKIYASKLDIFSEDRVIVEQISNAVNRTIFAEVTSE